MVLSKFPFSGADIPDTRFFQPHATCLPVSRHSVWRDDSADGQKLVDRVETHRDDDGASRKYPRWD